MGFAGRRFGLALASTFHCDLSNRSGWQAIAGG
jgi:hypothetical protein